MSPTYYIVTKQTKLAFWCGQSRSGWPNHFYLYDHPPEGGGDRCQDQVAAFLILHLGQEIAIVEDIDDVEFKLGWGDSDDWVIVEAIADGDYVAFVPESDFLADLKECDFVRYEQVKDFRLSLRDKP